MEAGACGYLVHGDASPDDIETAIRTVSAGKVYLSGRAGEVLMGLMSQVAPAEAPAVARDWGLTPREVEIMHLMGAGKSNGDIAGELFITPNTLKNHITRIFNKMGVTKRAEAIVLWLDAPGVTSESGR